MGFKFPMYVNEGRYDGTLLQFWSRAQKPRKRKIKRGSWNPKTGFGWIEAPDPYLYDPEWPTEATKAAWYLSWDAKMWIVGFDKDGNVVVQKREDDVERVDSW